MYKISVSKEQFEDILLKKSFLLEKQSTKYWKKELIDAKIVNNKISYGLKQIDKLFITNGLGEDKPQLTVQCKKIDYSVSNNSFVFHLGKIIEQKNISIKEDYKDILIERLIQEKLKLEDSLNKDHLTQIYNRKKMEDDLSSFIIQKNSFLLTAIFIDADRFKLINDNFGHSVGDKILIYLAQKLEEYAKRLNGFAYRYGGEEFVILCFVAKDRLIGILNTLKEDIKSQMMDLNEEIFITVSMGISFYDEYKNKDLFIYKADEALYKAKKNGRDRIEFAFNY